jgi:hypothetical protein
MSKTTDENFLGKGRSASVYKVKASGKTIARKVFTGSRTADFVMSLFYGAPVDYQWCEAAVKTAFYRRKVLAELLDFWFGDVLTISKPIGTGKDEETGYFYLDAEFVKGEAAELYNPFSIKHISEYHDLKDKIFPDLQQKLMESGFIGTVWQAGYGQPCSIANFLCVKYAEDMEKERWVWIDAESGVPALASHSIFKQLGFYIPQAIKRGRVLFDDVDEEILNLYILENEKDLRKKLGEKGFSELQNDISLLITEFNKWREETRFTRILKYFRNKEVISEDKYTNLLSKKDSKLGFMLGIYFPRQLKMGLSFIGNKLLKIVKTFNPVKWCLFFIKSGISRKYRIEKSRNFVIKRIGEWEELGRITNKQKGSLEKELYLRESNQYLADFGVFLALKPFGYFVKLCIVPILLFYGLLSPEAVVFIFAFFSLSIRFLYAFIRALEDLIRHGSFPYIAVLVAPIPTLGTLAYPCQMVHSARKGHTVSRFIMYEVFSAIAKKIPIWGGYNSEIEYFLNRKAYKIIKASE